MPKQLLVTRASIHVRDELTVRLEKWFGIVLNRARRTAIPDHFVDDAVLNRDAYGDSYTEDCTDVVISRSTWQSFLEMDLLILRLRVSADVELLYAC